MLKMRCVTILFVCLALVAVAAAQDMGPGGPGGPGGYGGPFGGGGGRGMRGMGMGGMGPGGMGGMGGGMRGMGGMGGGMGGGMFPGGGQQMGGMMSPEAMQQARLQRVQAVLQSIDTNHNGIIEQEEAQGPNAFMLGRILGNAGVQPTYPLPISKITEGMNNQFKVQTGQATPSSTPEKAKEESKPADSGSAPLVPGFGEAVASLPQVPGFGVALASAATGAKKSGSSSETSSSSSLTSTTSTSATPSTPPLNDKIREYAKSLLKQYDKNGNGQLEKEEWMEMKKDKWAADTNHDGIITLDELTAFMSADSGSGPRQSSNVAVASNSTTPGTATGAATNMMAMGGPGKASFPGRKTATERLPAGLPDWFARNDADGDGTVSMAEFLKAKGDTEAAAKEFAQYDLNGDGVLTPQEALKTAKKR
jgi:Ca2+-binding EF-hand superfamily protein